MRIAGDLVGFPIFASLAKRFIPVHCTCGHIVIGDYLQAHVPPRLYFLLTNHQSRISANSLSRKIPDFLGKWPSLETLRIQASGLEGPIPSSITHSESLTDLRINDLRGPDTLYPPISNRIRFKNLILRKCNLTGTLPTSLAPGEGDQELKVFYLTGNVLSGRQCEAGEGNAKTGKCKVLLEQDNRETNKARRDRCKVDNGLDHSGFAV